MSITNEATTPDFDVAIIGGGPGGSTLGTLLRKYDPKIRVLIMEKEKFPRDHIGESQLPPISAVLDEMGCWDKVEAADFPIKVGATFRWGSKQEIWDFEFLPLSEFRNEPRPGKYQGFRKVTAFQVDRSKYDTILLHHAEEMGCTVREQTQVSDVLRDGDRVTGLMLRSGEKVTARHYVDASGHVGILRRAMGVEIDLPTKLMNIAIWDYWENAEWAVEIGVGGTRIQVMSIDNGWLWFIPLGPTRTSLGFVCPAEYYKQSGKSPEELYVQAIAQSPRISKLVQSGTRSGEIHSTKDWSFCAEKTYGKNWFLVGEAAGFADPILSAGLTLTHTGARELAYSILALDRKQHDPRWLKEHYDTNQRKRVHQHIRFADFWYASNGLLTDLKEHCQEIARDAGLRLTPQSAWRWLAQGGFANDFVGQAGIGGYDLSAMQQLTRLFTKQEPIWRINSVNVFILNLDGAVESNVPVYHAGKIESVKCYERDSHRLVLAGMYGLLVDLIRHDGNMQAIYGALVKHCQSMYHRLDAEAAVRHGLQCLEVMLTEGWVTGTVNKKRAMVKLESPAQGKLVHDNRDEEIMAARQEAKEK